MKLNRKYLTFLIIGVFSLFTSRCTQMQLDGNINEAAKYATVKYQFNWSAIPDSQRPDSVYVLFHKISHSTHYIDVTCTHRAKREDQSFDQNYKTDSTLLKVKTGEYSILAFSKESANLELSILKQFKEDITIGLSEIGISIKENQPSAIPDDWIDFNPNYTYIKNTGILYSCLVEKVSVSHPSTTLQLTPSSITQHLTIQFQLQVENTIQVDSIIGEISGLARKVSLLSRKIDETSTHRMIFKPYQTGRSDNGLLNYEAAIDVLGLFPGTNATYITGPGIMQLVIYLTIENKKKILHRGINMLNAIRNADLLMPTADGTGQQIKKNNGIIHIKTILPIQETPLEGGLNGWFKSEDIKTEI